MAKYRVKPVNQDEPCIEIEGITPNDAKTKALQANFVLQKFSYTEIEAIRIYEKKEKNKNGK